MCFLTRVFLRVKVTVEARKERRENSDRTSERYAMVSSRWYESLYLDTCCLIHFAKLGRPTLVRCCGSWRRYLFGGKSDDYLSKRLPSQNVWSWRKNVLKSSMLSFRR
jgi:hypothetical protein